MSAPHPAVCGFPLRMPLRSSAAAKKRCAARDALNGGDGIAPQRIEAFCNSSYLSQEDYAETLCELTVLFYQAKSLTEDKLSDRALLH